MAPDTWVFPVPDRRPEGWEQHKGGCGQGTASQSGTAPSLLREVLAHSGANAGGKAGTLTPALSAGASAPLSEELRGNQKWETSRLNLTTWSHLQARAFFPLRATHWE